MRAGNWQVADLSLDLSTHGSFLRHLSVAKLRPAAHGARPIEISGETNRAFGDWPRGESRKEKSGEDRLNVNKYRAVASRKREREENDPPHTQGAEEMRGKPFPGRGARRWPTARCLLHPGSPPISTFFSSSRACPGYEMASYIPGGAEQFASLKNRPHAQDNHKREGARGRRKKRNSLDRKPQASERADVRKISRYGNVDLCAFLRHTHIRPKVKHYASDRRVTFWMRPRGDADVDNTSPRELQCPDSSVRNIRLASRPSVKDDPLEHLAGRQPRVGENDSGSSANRSAGLFWRCRRQEGRFHARWLVGF